jgi:hypothetical protein
MSEDATVIEREDTGGAEGEELAPPAGRQAAESLLNDEGGEADGKEVSAPADWPEDWREKLAGDDEKFLAQLKRYASPQNFAKKTRALEQKLSSGEYKRQLGENATPEEIAEWRKDNDIPDDVKGYELPKIPGHEWSEEDQPIVEDFLGHLHKANAPKGQAKAALEWYAGFQAQQEAQVFETDTDNRTKTEDALRAEWGPEYRANLSLMKRTFESDIPHGMDMAYARLPDGRRLVDSPDFCNWVTQVAREKYGDASIISGEGAAALADRKKEIEDTMRTDINKYWSDGLDKEYAQILEREHASQRRSA